MKRTAAATIARRAHAKARDRQEAWAEGNQARRTATLTRELDGLYGDLRRDRRAGYAEGEPEGTAYAGRTARAAGA